MKKTSLFESETCGRCGGSGSYSFNLMHGSTCYGCSGRGFKLTKRGSAAQAFFMALCSKPVEQFQPGDLIRSTGVTGNCGVYQYFARVISVELVPARRFYPDMGESEQVVYMTMTHKGQQSTLTTFIGSVERVGLTAEQKAPLIAQAKAYEASLTKAGTVPKRTKRAA